MAGEAAFDAGHADEDQDRPDAVEVVAELLDGEHLEPVGFVNDEKLGVIAARQGGLNVSKSSSAWSITRLSQALARSTPWRPVEGWR